jgi:RNA polymerase sigma factor (sigma-70 family)
LHEEQEAAFDRIKGRSAQSIPQAPVTSDAKNQILECIQSNTSSLLGTICLYVQRLGLASGMEAHEVASEVLQEVVIEALDHIDSFVATGQPRAWLLGIAINVIKQKKVKEAKRYRREILFGRLSLQYSSLEQVSDADLLDQIAPSSIAGPEQAIETSEEVTSLLSLVSKDDQQVLRLAFLEDFDREALAERLGTSTGAARMRLHRALSRLREAWFEQKRGKYDE